MNFMEAIPVMEEGVWMANKHILKRLNVILKYALLSTVCGGRGIHGLHVVKHVAEEYRSGHEKWTPMKKMVEQLALVFQLSSKTAAQPLVLLSTASGVHGILGLLAV